MESNYSESSSGVSVSNDLNLTLHLRDGSNSLSAERLLHTALVLDFYYTPIVCLFGSIGNCLSLIVFCTNASHRGLSSSYYLSALAISDTGFLINLFALWLEGTGVGVLSTQFGCTFIMFSGQVTCFLSVWLTVAFTIERFFAVCAPLSRPRVCTVSKAKKVICGLTGFALIAFSYVFFIARVIPGGPPTNQDEFNHEESHYHNISNPVSQFISPREETGTRLAQPSFNAPAQTQFPDRDRMRTGSQNYEDPFGVDAMDYALFTQSQTFSHDQVKKARSVEPSTGWINKSLLPSLEMINDSVLNFTNEGVFSEDEDMMLKCTVPDEYLTISTVATYLDSMITLIIPFCLIAFFNVRITATVWKLKDERKNILAVPKVNKSNKGYTQGSSSGGRLAVGQAGRNEEAHGRNTQQCNDSVGEMGESPGRKWTSRMMAQLCSCRSVFKRPRSPNSLESPINAEVHVLQSFESNCDAQTLQDQNRSCFHKETEIKGDEQLHPCESISRVDPEDNAFSHGVRSHEELTEISVKPSISYQSQPQQSSPRVGCSDSRNAITSNPGTVRINGKIPKRRTSVTSSATEARVTKMLLLVSTVFLVLNLPSHALRAALFIQRLVWEDDFEGQKKLYAAIHLSSILLFNTNFAVNFLLYCLSGRNFRKSLRNIFLRKSKKMALNRISRKSKTLTVRNRSDFGCRKTDDETVIFDDVSVGEPVGTHYHPQLSPRNSPVEEETRN